MPDEQSRFEALWEYRLSALEKRVDVMQNSLATKADLQRIEAAVSDIRDNKRVREDHTYDIRSKLWPPLLVGIILSIVNYVIGYHPK